MKRKFDLKITNTFFNSLRSSLKSKNVLLLKYSNFDMFPAAAEFSSKIMELTDNLELNDEKFDLIIGDLPFGTMKKQWSDEERRISIKAKQNWIQIFQSLFHLSENGFGLYMIEPAIWSNDWKCFSKELNSHGFYVNAVINTPQGILAPYTSVQPNLVIISRKNRKNLFIAELDQEENVDAIVENFVKFNDSNFLETGALIKDDSFVGFRIFKVSKEVEALETQYKDFKKYQLSEIANEIILGSPKKDFGTKDNAVYLPKVGTSTAVASLEKLKIKQQNYFQIVLNEKIVINEYLEQFFKSTLGKLNISTVMTGAVIPQISKKDLSNILIPIPSLKEQKILIDTGKRLELLKTKIEVFDNELALNPKSAHRIQDKLDNMLEALEELTDADKVKAYIRSGESKISEFKQTLSIDIKSNKKEKYIEKASLKTVVALLNTEGGVLLVGVNDSMQVTGVQDEIKAYYKNEDKFLLHFKNLIKSSIGENFYPSIDYKIVDVESNKILLVECKESLEPCYLDDKEFYVRTNPATDKLEGSKMVDYIKSHFGGK